MLAQDFLQPPLPRGEVGEERVPGRAEVRHARAAAGGLGQGCAAEAEEGGQDRRREAADAGQQERDGRGGEEECGGERAWSS